MALTIASWSAQKSESLVPFASGSSGNKSWRLYRGDSRLLTQQVGENSVDCVVTSPPYYWQRDYQVAGQIGLETTIDGYVDNLRAVFAGLWRVIKDTGTIFLNLGYTYSSGKGIPHGDDSKHRARRFGLRAVDASGLGLPRKSLIGIPWRVALALVADGWVLRSSIIWLRRTSVPEPTAKDRPWRQYEFVFLFAKARHYYFDRAGLGEEEDVWFIEPDRNSPARGTHYAPYPRALVERCLSIGCPDKGMVLDPFVGGGTTMSVALAMGRSCVGIDLNPDFCRLVRDRLKREGLRVIARRG